jgi:hypothetical protein
MRKILDSLPISIYYYVIRVFKVFDIKTRNNKGKIKVTGYHYILIIIIIGLRALNLSHLRFQKLNQG